ncbi:hypothetical protein DMB65_19060 [Flavobacterium cheongpyeongense]|uniref:Uncharacterized protein n=1 Tax=Flavobacterium cheongpyeongense TaxID=2212651 RepID=A0A2V4BJT1_9FLAO|nr:hypothetical protein DMB65_19060 [Flavobacterium cheongpyeongense]
MGVRKTDSWQAWTMEKYLLRDKKTININLKLYHI